MRKKKKNNKFLSFMLALILMLPTFLVLPISNAYAEDITISNVLDDLKRDSTFNVEDYPTIENDYSLQVITIAESTAKELLIYVYQPFTNESATSINISPYANDTLNIKNYKLTLLNSSETLFKYVVKDLQISSEQERFYTIISIFREWDPDLDKYADLTTENKVDEVAYNVGKEYQISISGDEQLINVVEIETIEITDKHVGFVRYGTGSQNWIRNSCDRHFVAFNTAQHIEKLLEADVYYKTQDVSCNYLDDSQLNSNNPFSIKFEDIKECYSHLSIEDKEVNVSVGSSGLIGNERNITYSWNGIETFSEFLATVNVENTYSMGVFNVNVKSSISEDALTALNAMQWVLSFDVTDYLFELGVTGGGGYVDYTIVSEVSILRLKYESNGKVFNLGVVDDKQTGSDKPINKIETKIELVDVIKNVLIAALAIILIIILFPYLPAIFKAIILIIKGIIWVICLPFKLIKLLIDKLKGGE